LPTVGAAADTDVIPSSGRIATWSRVLENPRIRSLVFFFAAAVIGSLFAVGLATNEFFQNVERSSYDWRVQNLRKADSPTTSALVLIDEETLSFLKEHEQIGWPLPRDMYCPVILWLAKAGAKAVAFDILYSDPTEFDSVFAECIADAGNVVLAFQCHEGAKDPAPPAQWGWPVTRKTSGPAPKRCEYVLPAADAEEDIKTLRTAPHAGGLVTVAADPDGVLRHLTPLVPGKNQHHAVLGLAAFLATQSTPTITLTDSELRIDERVIPLDEAGQAVVRWRPQWPPFPIYSFSQIYAASQLEDAGEKSPLDASLFKDKVIFMGTSAAGTYETRVTPVRETDYGIHLHASFYEAIVSGDHNRRISRSLNILLAIILAFLMAAAATVPKSVLGEVAASGVLFAGYIGAALFLFDSQGIWLDIVAPMTGMTMSFLVVVVTSYLTEGRQKKQIRTAFSMYLSPVVIKSLVEDPSKLKLGGERRQITSFFSDVAGFTSFSEKMEPHELVAFLNIYLTEMTNIIQDEGGTIDKYEGDAIIAMFGAPLHQPDHAVAACRAALRCQSRLAELRPQWVAEGLPECRMRIGLNSGDAVVGNMGSTQRFDYTMMGDTVNLAARLEGTNKVYGTELMVGENTEELVGDLVLMRELDSVRVKGKKKPVRVYEPLATADETEAKHRDLAASWEKCLQCYREQQFEQAHILFKAHLKQHPEDNAAREFLDRCSAFQQFPPGDDWDGVYEMKTK